MIVGIDLGTSTSEIAYLKDGVPRLVRGRGTVGGGGVLPSVVGLLPDGTLDRPKLGRVVFADEGRRRALNAIVHPAVRREMFWSVLRHWWRGERVCVLDVPLLIEGGLWKWVGKVVVVYWCVRHIHSSHSPGEYVCAVYVSIP